MGEMIEQLVRRYEGGKLTRRELVLSLSALLLARPEASAQPSAPPIPVSTLNHVTLVVSDVQRSVEFYQRVFGMPLVTTQGRPCWWALRRCCSTTHAMCRHRRGAASTTSVRTASGF